MNRLIYSFLLISICCFLAMRTAHAQPLSSSFAIVIDSATYSKTQESVQLYANAVKQDGLFTYILHRHWNNPDQIRAELIKLSKQQPPLEGVVFIGDIPVPMLRDAQHLTSAFKMDQNSKRFSWKRSSVPSDRFYDDFDLKFTFLKQDTSDVLLFYYSLNPDSPQKIRSDIYSARIKAPVNDSTKYGLIDRYLRRIAREKNKEYTINRAFVFTGHGYHSESLDAWSSSLLSYKEQFPQLFIPGNRLKFYNHSMNPQIKAILRRELEDKNLDLAVFHAHGAPTKQYLVGFDPAHSITQNIESIKLFLRGKLRQAKRRKKSLEKTRQDYMQRYGIPLKWFEGAFSDSLKEQDSLLYASQDMHISEIESMTPGAKLIYLDECFNGAFIHSPYVAGAYLFAQGGTIATIGNTVNVRQDVWATQFLGLLNHGLRIGEWLRLQHSLERHIFGDPTFHFQSAGRISLTHSFNSQIEDESALNSWLKESSADLRSIAVSSLSRLKGKDFENELVELYKKDVSFNVRLQALKCLAGLRSATFEAILFAAAEDPAEMIRRISAVWMGDTGQDKYLEPLSRMYIFDVSDRVRFNADQALEKIDPVKAEKACEKALIAMPESPYRNQILERVHRSFKRDEKWLNNDLLKKITSPSEPLKKRIGAVRSLRNYRFQQAVPVMLDVLLKKNENLSLRLTLAEALGWYGLNFRRPQIIASCNKLIVNSDTPAELKKMALRTKNRLVYGLNDPVTP